MRVFITGASGFIGMAVTKELVAAGHQVLGLCRSEEKAPALAAAGAEVFSGSLEDLDRVKAGAAQSDGVIHLAFNHDFSRYAQNCEDDRRVIAALGAALSGTRKPLLVTSGASMTSTGPGVAALEDGPVISAQMIPRAASEEAAAALVQDGINVSVVRLPQVHDTMRQGLVSPYIAIAREKGFCAYVGDGSNRWTAAHVSDVARLYRLALEKAHAGAKWHAVAEEGVTMRSIADVLGKRLDLTVASITPEEAPGYFGWLAMFAAFDAPSSSAQTRARLGWNPTGPTLLEDLANLELAES